MELLPSLWIQKHQIKNESGVPIEFDRHNFMRDLYNDMSPLQVWLKPPQIGATVAQIIKSFYVANKLHKDIIYTLPTQGDVQDMAGGKINRIVAQNPVLKEWVKDHDTVEQKSIGDNIIHYRGSWTTKSAMMVSSSLNIHDELDASNPQVVAQYETRLQAQADGWRWYFSHPSITDFGVDKHWQNSDQKHWFITCPHCTKKQYLSFPENIDKGRKMYVCKHCNGELSNSDRERGVWIPKYSKAWQIEQGINKPFSGYWISQLMCSWITAEKILDDYANKPADYFYNYVLGLPYAGGDSKLTQKHLFQNLTNESTAAESNERIVIGIDTGLKIDYVIGNQRLGLFFHGDTDNYNTLDTIMRRYPKAIAVIDAGGDFIGAQQFQERWNGRVFKCYTNTQMSGDTFAVWGEGEKYGQVQADRNKAIQRCVDEFRTKRIPLQGNESDWYEYWLDWSNLSRMKIFDPKTNELKGIKWIRNGRDHRALATMLWRIGVDKFTDTQAEIVYPNSDFAQQGFEG